MSLAHDHLRAILPDVTHVLGRRLRPFSLGHQLILRRLSSPFLEGGKRIRYDHVLEAAYVCSLTYEDGYAWLNNPDTGKPLRRWSHRLTWFGFKSVNYNRAIETLAGHIRAAHTAPSIVPKAESETVCRSPEASILISHALSIGLSLSDAFNLPLGLIVWLYITAGELRGTLALADHDQLAAYEKQTEEVLKEFTRRYEAGEFNP